MNQYGGHPARGGRRTEDISSDRSDELRLRHLAHADLATENVAH
jgi:hypothetical protein